MNKALLLLGVLILAVFASSLGSAYYPEYSSYYQKQYGYDGYYSYYEKDSPYGHYVSEKKVVNHPYYSFSYSPGYYGYYSSPINYYPNYYSTYHNKVYTYWDSGYHPYYVESKYKYYW